MPGFNSLEPESAQPGFEPGLSTAITAELFCPTRQNDFMLMLLDLPILRNLKILKTGHSRYSTAHVRGSLS